MGWTNGVRLWSKIMGWTIRWFLHADSYCVTHAGPRQGDGEPLERAARVDCRHRSVTRLLDLRRPEFPSEQVHRRRRRGRSVRQVSGCSGCSGSSGAHQSRSRWWCSRMLRGICFRVFKFWEEWKMHEEMSRTRRVPRHVALQRVCVTFDEGTLLTFFRTPRTRLLPDVVDDIARDVELKVVGVAHSVPLERFALGTMCLELRLGTCLRSDQLRSLSGRDHACSRREQPTEHSR